MSVGALLPCAVSSSDWTAVGSIGTAIAVLIALGSLLIERRARQQSEAAQIRERVQLIANRTRQLAKTLEDGSPLIDAAWHTAKSVRVQTGEEVTAEDMRKQIGDRGVALTAAVEGWSSSPASVELRDALAALSVADHDLTGHLSLFSPTTELLREIARDGYSNSLFIRLLTDPIAGIFNKEHVDEDVDGLTRSLAAHLHGNASSYFLVRYESALSAIVSFVETAASAFVAPKPPALVRASREKSPIAIHQSFTGELRDKLVRLRGRFPDDVIDSLSENVDQIEATIGKDSAEQRLADEDPAVGEMVSNQR